MVAVTKTPPERFKFKLNFNICLTGIDRVTLFFPINLLFASFVYIYIFKNVLKTIMEDILFLLFFL